MMVNGQKVLALIPARGGSKGIKNKNIVLLKGKPLLAYTIDAALKSGVCDKVIVSTDSPEIAQVARQLGAETPFLRPHKLAQDHSKTIDSVLHAIKELQSRGDEFDILLLLQPTQPFRKPASIVGAIETFINKNCESLLSVCEVKEHPILIRSILNEGKVKRLLDINSTVRRQEFEKFYKVNGAIYLNKIDSLNPETSFNDNLYGYIMPQDESIDIDTPDDLQYAEFLLNRNIME